MLTKQQVSNTRRIAEYEINKIFRNAIKCRMSHKMVVEQASKRIWQRTDFQKMPIKWQFYYQGYFEGILQSLFEYHLVNVIEYKGEWIEREDAKNKIPQGEWHKANFVGFCWKSDINCQYL